MASGNQVCSGSCADFPSAPPRSNVAAATADADPTGQACEAPCRRGCMSKVPRDVNSSKRPIAKAVSPIRVTINAFWAARPLAGSRYQKPMSR
jgi:hypothetical protein